MVFRILGQLEVSSNGRWVSPGGPRQQNVLGALLLSAGQVVPLTHLVEVAWEHSPPVTADKQVRNIASDLRGRLGGMSAPIVATAHGYRLDVADSDLDARVFARLAAKARHDARSGRTTTAIDGFRSALELWRGPVLAGLTSAALEPQATRLSEDRLVVLEEYFELALAEGRHRAVVGELSEAVMANPFRERLAAQLMLALYRLDRQADSLAVYEQSRETLAEQLGIDPGPGLQALRQRVLVNDPALNLSAGEEKRQKSRCDLPRDVNHFVGRAAGLRTVVERLPAPHREQPTAAAVCLIDGMAGVGKTTLAVHAAHLLAERYPDGQLFVDLRAHSPGRDPLRPVVVLDRLLRAVGVPGSAIPADLDERAALWRAQLASRHMLVILDDALDAAQVRPLLPGTSRCLTLVTSRSRLTELGSVHVVSLDVLSYDEARDLLAREVGDRRPLDEPGALDQLVEICGQLPLAIQIVAARLRHRPSWTLAHLAERLRDRRQRLTELRFEDMSIGSAFATSYERLSADEQRLFGLLGSMPRLDFDPSVASAVANVDRHVVEDQLEGLVDAHLLRQWTPGRYHFHDLLKVYASRPEITSAEERRADHLG